METQTHPQLKTYFFLPKFKYFDVLITFRFNSLIFQNYSFAYFNSKNVMKIDKDLYLADVCDAEAAEDADQGVMSGSDVVDTDPEEGEEPADNCSPDTGHRIGSDAIKDLMIARITTVARHTALRAHIMSPLSVRLSLLINN